MEILLFAPVALVASLFWVNHLKKRGRNPKTALLAQIGVFFVSLLAISAFGIGNVALAAEDVTEAAAANASAMGMGMLAAALAVGMAGIGGGIGVAASASAAIGAVSENEKLFGKALIFVAMAEGIAIYGVLIAFMILFKF